MNLEATSARQRVEVRKYQRKYANPVPGSGVRTTSSVVAATVRLTPAGSSLPLVVPTYNLAENDVYLFKTPHHPRRKRDWRVPMWEVAMATSAAPTFFPAYRLSGDGVRLIDGGVWANNPAMVGLTEAVSLFERRLCDVRVLSVGTTSGAQARPRRLDNAGIVR